MAEISGITSSDAEAREIEELVEKEVRGGTEPSNITEQNLSPDYIYTTNQSAENFGNTPFAPLPKTRNNLNPPSAFKPYKKPKGEVGYDPEDPRDTDFCIKNPTHPRCLSSGGETFCEQNPSHPNCTDETDAYGDLGLFQEKVRYIFDPSKRSQEIKKKPVQTLYESTRDNTQLETPQVIRTECRCKDGTKVMGWLDVRSGQKDCSPCRKRVFNSPNVYKNYKTKRKTPNFSGKSVPLRKQVGVSHFGDVNLKGCQTGNASQSLEQRNKISTLNNITNIDTQDSIGGSTINTPQDPSGMPISLYDNLKTNVYGL
tara:strand:+ start:387 stop:1328 length:942 start_codon:yes stop_codon:yes gene_type:complete